jgi:hypothetical protein
MSCGRESTRAIEPPRRSEPRAAGCVPSRSLTRRFQLSPRNSTSCPSSCSNLTSRPGGSAGTWASSTPRSRTWAAAEACERVSPHFVREVPTGTPRKTDDHQRHGRPLRRRAGDRLLQTRGGQISRGAARNLAQGRFVRPLRARSRPTPSGSRPALRRSIASPASCTRSISSAASTRPNSATWRAASRPN